ncbi:MAG: 5-amino-6-(D-ribitylamino)uracil--L-tyrosine 4-hydroxyphenyl transferase CofH [Gammaproteobacteria bacterium]|nr:5-amino-6-(D-ribitylamino)uracil--L-tyrosine 4-hydroxyphenyl transferase CofH [Gammaproteobacteria bacterium]
MRDIQTLLARAANAERLGTDDLSTLAQEAPLSALVEVAGQLRDQGHGDIVSFSPKVFIPLTMLCRDVCHYCTFARSPRRLESAYLNPEQVLDIARAGERAGCREALFTLGDKPELRYRAAREALAELGYETTIDYLVAMCELVLKETSLLPHVNPGVLTADDLARLRRVSVSQGIMLESASQRLCQRGEVHFGSPDKNPDVRLETLRLAGEASVPFTSGILIGIGETRDERIDSLLKLREVHERYGHIQELIIQNFRAKPDTKMAQAPEPDLDDLMWTLAMTRIAFGPQMNIQAPPNLSPDAYGALIDAGLNDWGGVSPVTPDHVNPEAPWPELVNLRAETIAAGKRLVPRLATYPQYLLDPTKWLDKALRPRCAQSMDTLGFAREDSWVAGQSSHAPSVGLTVPGAQHDEPTEKILRILDRAGSDATAFSEDDIERLFEARGADFNAVCDAADTLRAKRNGDVVSYVVTRNINYTNVCYFKCQFCAFSKGKASENLRGKPYDLDLDEVQRRVREAWDRGATEVCMQGGIHPGYTGNTYLTLCRAAKEAAPDIHIHAFSPLEISQGAKTLGLPVSEFLIALKEAGLGTLPGTAAEILDDEVRDIICPDKLRTQEWIDVIEAAHGVGLKTTSTIMFGHVDTYRAWARHLLHLRTLQSRTGGITEFVPLPFVHMEAPIFRKGFAREGATFREAVLMHAVARLVLDPGITNIQTSWTKMGVEGAKACLSAGANDLGGTLMNESISRAAGAAHGQELDPTQMERTLAEIGRKARQRTTLYGDSSDERRESSMRAQPLLEVVLTPATKAARVS